MSGTRLRMSTRPASSCVCAGESCGAAAGMVDAQAQSSVASAPAASPETALVTISGAFKGEVLVVGTEIGVGINLGHPQRGRCACVGEVQPGLVEAMAVPVDQQALADRHHLATQARR